MSSKTLSYPSSRPSAGLLALVKDFVILSKPRISVMVLLTVAVAGWISKSSSIATWPLIHGMIGLFFVSASGCALNQYLERYVDWLMPRTAKRPLPDDRLTATQVAVFGAITFGFGIGYLWMLTNWQTAAIAGGTWVLYVWIYTPLKAITWLNTYVGAVAGAAPVFIGSTSVMDGTITTATWALFGVLYIWQFPHFMAIAWLYREDYELGGLKMVTRHDPQGIRTGWHAVIFAVLLLPLLAFSSWSTHPLGIAILLVNLALGGYYVLVSHRFNQSTNDVTARKLFRYSLLFLPCYLALLSLAEIV